MKNNFFGFSTLAALLASAAITTSCAPKASISALPKRIVVMPLAPASGTAVAAPTDLPDSPLQFNMTSGVTLHYNSPTGQKLTIPVPTSGTEAHAGQAIFIDPAAVSFFTKKGDGRHYDADGTVLPADPGLHAPDFNLKVGYLSGWVVQPGGSQVSPLKDGMISAVGWSQSGDASTLTITLHFESAANVSAASVNGLNISWTPVTGKTAVHSGTTISLVFVAR